MKTLKLLNKKNLSIIIFSLLITSSPFAEEKPVDIWNIEKTQNVIEKKLLKNNGENNNFETVQEIEISDQNKI